MMVFYIINLLNLASQESINQDIKYIIYFFLWELFLIIDYNIPKRFEHELNKQISLIHSRLKNLKKKRVMKLRIKNAIAYSNNSVDHNDFFNSNFKLYTCSVTADSS